MPRIVGRLRPERWPQVTVDEETGEQRPASDHELLQMGMHVVARLPDGSAVVDCAAWRPEEQARLPIERISEGLADSRWARMPPGAEKRACHRARVYRARDGSDLRAACSAAVGRQLEARVPAKASKSAIPADPPGALEVLAEARRRVDAGEAEVVEVAMSDVLDGDVVEEDGIRPHRWLGEAED